MTEPSRRGRRKPARRRGSGTRSEGSHAGAGEGTDPPPRPPVEVARAVCLRLLAQRPRTRAELATALRRADVPNDAAAAVLERFGEVGLIDDAAFARAWVTTRHHGRGLARAALARELRQRGVAADAVGEALRQVDAPTEEATARALVQRRLRTERAGRPDALFRRLVGMLARRGYPPALAVRVVRDALAEREVTAAFAEGVDADVIADLMGSDTDHEHRTNSPIMDP